MISKPMLPAISIVSALAAVAGAIVAHASLASATPTRASAAFQGIEGSL